ncbi:DUF3098 domain-containing protein [Marinilabiliaceae bacterium ANBcel2]|nr:DUF3098 domain-containing protein [Marinilabiliaceae bacterium ANBcel2]
MPTKKRTEENFKKKKFEMALHKENYILLIISFAIIVIGFLLMIGGGSDDPNVFDESVYGFRRVTLAPMISLFGFVFAIYAILKKPKIDKTDSKKNN